VSVVADESSVAEAERLVEEFLWLGSDDSCTRAAVMSTVARLAVRGGDAYRRLRKRTELQFAELQACASTTMVVRELTARANAFAEEGRWCLSAKDNGDAFHLQPHSLEALLNWAEASLQCRSSPVEHETLRAALALGLERFVPGAPRTSVAFMLWLITRELADAQAVLTSYDQVPLGEVPLLEGTASSLASTVCPDPAQPCVYELLQRPKQAGHRSMLRRGLGLDG
jgi:hypothetical protein